MRKKNKGNRKGIAAAILLAAAAACSGCGTSAVSNTQSYWSHVGSIITTAAKQNAGNDSTSASSSADAASTAAKTPLDTPSGFTVDADGNYSFGDVADAGNYMIYICDTTAVNDGDDYLYASTPIKDDDSTTYTGNLSDLM